MKKIALCCLSTLLLLPAAPLVCADDAPAAAATATITVDHAWVRAVPPVSHNTAAYVRIQNNGSSADALVSASSPAATRVQLHRMSMNGNMMKMEAVKKIEIGAGKTVELNPDGYHIMLEDLKSPLKTGDDVPLTLHFRKAGDINVTAKVTADTN